MSWIKKIWIASWSPLSRIAPTLTAQWAQSLFLTPEKIQRPLSEKNYYESAKKYRIQNRIAAYEWGNSEHPLIILVHGWSGRGTQMAAFAEPLVKNNLRVIAVDGPGHGDSDGTTTHVGEFAQFLIDIQQDLGSYEAVVAHSFGAGCSVLAASRGLNVRKLVLIAGPSRYELVVQYFLNQLKLSSKSQEHFLKSLAKLVNLPVSEMNVGQIGNSLSIPTLIVHDEEDKEVNVIAADEIKSHWPNAKVFKTKGLGHRRVLKDAIVIEAVSDFLKTGP